MKKLHQGSWLHPLRRLRLNQAAISCTQAAKGWSRLLGLFATDSLVEKNIRSLPSFAAPQEAC